MDTILLNNQEQKESLEIILYNVREADSLKLMTDSLDLISKLCQGYQNIKLTLIKCKQCTKPISGRDEEIVKLLCKKYGNQKTLYFHKRCLKECLQIQGKTYFRCCTDKQCFDERWETIQLFCNNYDLICQFKCEDRYFSNMLQETIKTGCECPFKRVHKDCLRKKYENFNIKQHEVKCADCFRYYREENVIQIIQNFMYGCSNCYDKNSNHTYWEFVPIDCWPYKICRNCYENLNFDKIDFRNQVMDQIRCHHDRQCQQNLSFHSLNQYFNKLEKVENKQNTLEIFKKYQINLENYFNVAKCPGFIIKDNIHSANYKFLEQANNTHQILYSQLLNGNDIDDFQSDFPDFKTEIIKCQNTFEADTSYQMQRCSNCNYKFCFKCQMPHFGIPCTVYQQIKIPADLNEESFLENNYFDEHRSLLITLNLNLFLFQFQSIMQFRLENTENGLYFNYPINKNINVIQINTQFLYGQYQQIFDSWYFMYLPIMSINHLRQSIQCGIERNISYQYAQMTARNTEKMIQFGTILYSEYEYALDVSPTITMYDHSEVKIALLCRVDPKSIKQPQSYQSLYISSQTIIDEKSIQYKDQSTIIAFQILVFKD